jgi:hypothetical protein
MTTTDFKKKIPNDQNTENMKFTCGIHSHTIKLHDVNIIIFAVNYLTLSATMTNQIKVFVTV